MKEVNLCRTKLSDDKAAILSSCLQNVEVLNVSECELTTNGIQCIAKAIKQKNEPVGLLTHLSLKIFRSNQTHISEKLIS